MAVTVFTAIGHGIVDVDRWDQILILLLIIIIRNTSSWMGQYTAVPSPPFIVVGSFVTDLFKVCVWCGEGGGRREESMDHSESTLLLSKGKGCTSGGVNVPCTSGGIYVRLPLVEFIYLGFTRMPGESYRRRLSSLLLYLCSVFRTLMNSLAYC